MIHLILPLPYSFLYKSGYFSVKDENISPVIDPIFGKNSTPNLINSDDAEIPRPGKDR